MNIQVGLHSGGRLLIADGVVDVSEVQLEDLAFGLSHVTRFGGQYGAFSVLEHSSNMMRWAKSQYRSGFELKALGIHDAPECLGFGDFQRFVKKALFPEDGKYRALDLMVLEALWGKFCPDAHQWLYYEHGVKNFDRAIGALEAKHFGAPHDPSDLPFWGDYAYYTKPRLLRPEQAQEEWLQLWREAV